MDLVTRRKTTFFRPSEFAQSFQKISVPRWLESFLFSSLPEIIVTLSKPFLNSFLGIWTTKSWVLSLRGNNFFEEKYRTARNLEQSLYEKQNFP
jgi:hypothetical protein